MGTAISIEVVKLLDRCAVIKSSRLAIAQLKLGPNTGSGNMDSDSFDVRSDSSLSLSKVGGALAEESQRAQEAVVRDTFTRPAGDSTTLITTVAGFSFTRWYSPFRQLIERIIPRNVMGD